MSTPIKRILFFFETVVKRNVSNHPQYPNKLQVSALQFYFRSFPFVPTLPISWNSKERKLVPLKSTIKRFAFLTWLFFFDFLIGIIFPCILLWLNFKITSNNEIKYKLEVTTTTFNILYIVGTLTSVNYVILFWTDKAAEISYDYKVIGKFTNFLYQGTTKVLQRFCLKTFTFYFYFFSVRRQNTDLREFKRKIDVIGILTCLNCAGFIISAYLVPVVSVFFKMDPLWHILYRIFPLCVLDSGCVSSEIYCVIIFYGFRSICVISWMLNSGKIMGGTMLFAWIFFELFNECAAMLQELKSEQGMHLYKAYWKVASGFRYYRTTFAVGIYGGIWILTVCLYATVVIIPNVSPLTFVYVTFPLCGGVGVLAFMFLPYALKFTGVSQNLIRKWRYAAGENAHCWKNKIMRREIKAMQPVVIKVGEYFLLDKSVAAVVIDTILNETVRLIVSLRNL